MVPTPSLRATALLLALAAGPLAPALESQTCELRLRRDRDVVPGAPFLPYETVTLSQGQTLEFENDGVPPGVPTPPGEHWGLNLRVALNEGTNDMRIRISAAGFSGDVYLLRDGSQTVVLPPTPFLHNLEEVECLSHAVIAESRDFLQELGSSTAEVVETATDRARDGAEEVRDRALDAFDPQRAQALLSEAGDARRVAERWWESAQGVGQRTATGVPSLVDRGIESAFPELHEAIRATTRFSVATVGDHVRQERTRFQRTFGVVQELDRKYRVSRTAAEVVSLDLERDFPELSRFATLACEAETGPLDPLVEGVDAFVTGLQRLDREYGVSSTAGAVAAALPRDVTNALSVARRESWCEASTEDLFRALDRDVGAVADYGQRVRQARRQLRSMNARTRAAVEAVDEAESEVRERGRTYREARGRVRRATRDARAAQRRLERGQYADEADRRSDISTVRRMAMLRRRAARAGAAYRDARQRYRQAVVRVRRLQSRRGSALEAYKQALADFPSLSVAASAFDQAETCAGRLEDALGDAVRALSGGGAATAAADAIPPAVRNQMTRTGRSAEALQASLGEVVQKAGNLVAARRGLAQARSQLVRALREDPTGPRYRRNVLARRRLVANRSRTVARASEELQQAGGQVRSRLDAHLRQRRALQAALQRESGKAVSEVARLLNETEGALAGGVDDFVRSRTECAAEMARAAVEAGNTLEERLDAFLSAKVNAVAGAVPAEVREDLDRVVARGRTVNEEFARLLPAAAELVEAGADLGRAHGQLEAAVAALPARGADPVVEATGEVQEAADGVQDAAVALDARREALLLAKGSYDEAVEELRATLRAQGGEAAADARRLAVVVVGDEVLTDAIRDSRDLRILWVQAARAMPGRAASLAVGTAGRAIPDPVRDQIRGQVGRVADLVREMEECRDAALQARGALQGAQAVGQAAGQAVAGVQSEASGVISDLQGLLSPSLNMMDGIATVMDRARSLRETVQDATEGGAEAFEDVHAAALDDVRTANSCLDGRHTRVFRLVRNVQERLIEYGYGTAEELIRAGR